MCQGLCNGTATCRGHTTLSRQAEPPRQVLLPQRPLTRASSEAFNPSGNDSFAARASR